MTAATVAFDPRSVVSNDEIQFLLPEHEDSATAAVFLTVDGDVTPVDAAPVGWTAQTASYESDGDVTTILWTNDAGLDADETTVTVGWTGSAKAAGVAAVSDDTTGLGQVGAVDSRSTIDSTGEAPSVTTVATDEYPLLFGGTGDVAASSDRYPDLTVVSDANLTDMVRTSAVAAGIDAWCIHGPAGLPAAGATGAITYGMLGTGSGTADPVAISSVGFGTFGVDANEAHGPETVPWPSGAEVGDVAVIGATGQPPDVGVSTPGVDDQDEVDSAGVAVTTLDITVPVGSVGKTAVIELAVEGSPGTVSNPAGWVLESSFAGIGYAWAKVVEEDDEVVTLSWSTARVARAQVLVVDGELVGATTEYTSANTAQPYGDHPSPEQTGTATSLHLLTWVARTATATVSSTSDGHTVTNNALPGSHTHETGYATDIPGAGVDPAGTATMASATDAMFSSWIFDPRPVNPTNLEDPDGWDVVHSQDGVGDAPSTYVWSKTLDADDITAGSVVVSPVGATGEFSGAIGLYRGVNPTTHLDGSAITSGATYSAASSSAALPTTVDNAIEVVMVSATDHGDPSHADSTVTAMTMGGGFTDQASVLDPAGSAVNLFDLARPTAGAGTARAGTVVNGLANEVNHETVAFALAPADATGSRQTSMLVTFEPAADLGPTVSWTAPSPGGGCVVDPVTFSGSAADSDGVSSVDVTIVRDSDGLYWNGASWVAGPVSNSATLGTPGGTTTTWSFTATGALTLPGSYTVTVEADDALANTRTVSRSICVAGAEAVQAVRRARLGGVPEVMVELYGRPFGVAPHALIARLNPVVSESSFGRRLDATSEANVVARLSPLDRLRLGTDLAPVDTWATWMRVFWDDHLAFAGPLTFIRWSWDQVFLKAQDPSVYWHVRAIDADITHEATDLATIFGDYHRNVYNQGPWGMDVIAGPIGVTGDRQVLASDGMIAWTGMSELARTGLDFTVYGTTLLVGGEEVPVAPLTTLTDEHFTEPLNVVDDGSARATDYVVSGGDRITGRSTLPESSDRFRRYGLLTGRSQERQILDEFSAGRAAQTRLEYMQDSIVVEAPSSAVLHPDAPVDLVDLVPGARVDIEATATPRRAVGQFRLERVDARFDGRVSVGFQPLGSLDPGRA